MPGQRTASVASVAAAILLAHSSAAGQGSLVTEGRASQDLAMVEQAYAERQGPQAQMWRDRIEAAEGELDRSLDRLVRSGEGEKALRFADAMTFFWTAFSEPQKARDRLTQALAMPSASGATAIRAKALYDAGLVAFRQGDQDRSRALNEESLAISQELNDRAAMATALIGLSRIALRDHDYASVRRYADQSLKLRQAIGDTAGEIGAVHLLAAAARMDGDSKNASKFYELTLGIYGETGNKNGVAGELMNLGFVRLHDHDADWAFRLFKESVSAYRGLQFEPGLAYNIGGFAAVAAERRQAALATTLYGALAVAMEKLAIVLDPDDQLDFDRYTSMAREQMDTSAFDAASAEGRRLSVDGAIELALMSLK